MFPSTKQKHKESYLLQLPKQKSNDIDDSHRKLWMLAVDDVDVGHVKAGDGGWSVVTKHKDRQFSGRGSPLVPS